MMSLRSGVHDFLLSKKENHHALLDVIELQKRIDYFHAYSAKVILVTCYNGQVVDERDGGNLLVDGMLWMRRHQASPDLRALFIKSQNSI